MDSYDILTAFQGKLVGRKEMKWHVCEVLAQMPKKTIDHITSTCWFMASLEDAYAFTFTGNDLKDQHLVFLSDDLLRQGTLQIYYTIAHEIGHVMLGHRNSVLEKQSKEEVSRQEHEADEFAKRYI